MTYAARVTADGTVGWREQGCEHSGRGEGGRGGGGEGVGRGGAGTAIVERERAGWEGGGWGGAGNARVERAREGGYLAVRASVSASRMLRHSPGLQRLIVL